MLEQVFGGPIIRDSKVFRRAVREKKYAVPIAFFRRRFADSLKQSQPRIHRSGKILAVGGGLRLHELEVISRRNGGRVVEGDSRRLEERKSVVGERYEARSVLEPAT